MAKAYFKIRFTDQEFIEAAQRVTWAVLPTAGGSNNLTKLLKEELSESTGARININSVYDALRRLKDKLPVVARGHYLQNLAVIDRAGPRIIRRRGKLVRAYPATSVKTEPTASAPVAQEPVEIVHRASGVSPWPKTASTMLAVNVSADEFVDAVLGKLISADTTAKILEAENIRLGDEIIKKNKAIELLECQVARLMDDLKKRNSASIQALAKVVCR